MMEATPAEQALFALKVASGVFALVWMFRDARARDANPTLWTASLAFGALFIHWIFPLAGAAVYWYFRPKGKVYPCPHCGAGYVEWLAECPKCERPLKKDCTRCHASVPITAATCPECDALL